MRITLESDYALRILDCLASHGEVVDAQTLSEETSVTTRFTIKILHKLLHGDLVRSVKGARGGYLLNRSPEDITLRQVIELIDGPIVIARCLENSESCSLNRDKSACAYHHIFDRISFDVAKKLGSITIADVKNHKINTDLE